MSENTENTAETAPERPAEATDSVQGGSTPAETVEKLSEPDSGEPAGSVPRLSKWPTRYREAFEQAQAEHAAEVEKLTAEHATAAAELNTKLEELTADRDATAALLAAERQQILDRTLKAAGLDPRLFEAAGNSIDSVLGDDGILDADKLGAAVEAAIKTFGIQPRPRRPRPVPHVGSGGERYGPTADRQWREAFGVK